MKGVGLVVAIALLASCGEAPSPSGKAIAWETDYQKGMARAKTEGKPVMIYFSADW